MQIEQKTLKQGETMWRAKQPLKQFYYIHLISTGEVAIHLKKQLGQSVIKLCEVSLSKADKEVQQFIDQFAKQYPTEYNQMINIPR